RPEAATELKQNLKAPLLTPAGALAATGDGHEPPVDDAAVVAVEVSTDALLAGLNRVWVELPAALTRERLGATDEGRPPTPTDAIGAVNLYVKQLLIQRHLSVSERTEFIKPERESHRLVRLADGRCRLERLYFD
ncbi:MAG: hypothetical protein K2V38_12590, partial [Gemmataceae bacterium]|nr:hypothetical protein [Gemmataceae bacterium]